MSYRLTEEEAKAQGFIKDGKGNWVAKPVLRHSDIQRRNPSEVSKLERHAERDEKRAVPVYKQDARSCSGGNHESFRIVVTAYYRKHVDPDNICPKWFVDQLKQCCIIPDDSSEYVKEFVKRVVKIESWEPEITVIEVWRLR